MADNQNTIETLQSIQKYFDSLGFHMSSSKIQYEIEKLQPKPEYVLGKAYVLWSTYREEFYDAIYVGGEQPWASYDKHSRTIKYGSLHIGSYVVEPEKKELLVTEEDFKNASWNTTVRRRVNEERTWDVAVVNLSGSWYRDGIPGPHEAYDMAQLGPWEVVSSD